MPTSTAGRWYEDDEATPRADVASRTDTTTQTPVGAPFNVEDALAFVATLTVTAASGTSPNLTVKLQTSVDGTDWYDVASFAALTAAGTSKRVFGPLAAQARWVATITGTTPSFTYNITGTMERRRS